MGSAISSTRGVRNATFQFRDAAAPWVQDPRIRQALIFFTDRQSLVDSFQQGLAEPADTFVASTDPVYKLLKENGLTTYPFDPGKGAALLTTTGVTPQIEDRPRGLPLGSRQLERRGYG